MVKDFTKDDAEKKKKKVLYPKKITPIEYDSVRRENETTQTPVTSLPASFVPAPFGYQNNAPIGSLKSFTKVAEDRPSLGAMEEFFKERTAKHISLVKKYLDRLEKHYPWHFTDDHDKSKYNDPEHEPYLYITWKHKMKDEDKDWEMPKKWKDRCDEATFHHIKTNKHHPEYWDKTLTENPINKEDRDKPSGKVVDATGMPDNYLLEMVADWCAMSEEKGNTPKEWADDNIGKRWKFSEFQKDTIYEAIDKIWDKGKKKAAKMFTKTSEVESKYLSIVQSPSSNMRLVYYKDKFVGTILNKEKEDIWGPEDNWGYSSNKFGPWTFGFSDPYDAVKALLSTEKIAVRIKPKPEEEEYQPPQNIEDLFRASIEAYQRGYTSPEIMRDIQKYIDLNRLEALQELQKQAQVQPGSLLVSPATQSLIDSPRIEIEPTIKAEIQDAVQQLIASDPSYFKGISKIVALHSGPYGQVSSEDPSVIHLNVQRIKNDIKQHLGSNFNSNDAEHREMFEEAVKQAIIEVVSHEKGHVLDYDPERGFPGGEGVAEQESRKMVQRLFPQSASKGFCKTAQETFQKGDFVRLMHSPEEWGMLTGRTKNLHGVNLYQVQFNPDLPDEFGVIEYKGDLKIHRWIPEDQLVKLESKPKEASLKTARDIGVPTAEVLFRDFMKFWMQYRSRLIQDYKKEGEDYTKADWANIFVDCWEDYTNKIQANLMQKQWDKDRIADFIEKLDEFAHAELDKYEIREGSVRYFTKQAQQTLTYGIDIDGTIADLKGLLIEIASKYIPIEDEDKEIYKVKDFVHGSQELQDKVFTELYEHGRLIDVKPLPNAVEKINELYDKGNKIIIITKRPENWQKQTKEWLSKNRIKYHKIIFTAEKGKAAKEEGVDIFIDDDIKNIQDVRQEGVPAYLFSQPWNEDEAESHVMTEWKEVKAFCKRASPRWTTEEKNRLKKLYLKYRQRGIPHHVIYKACAVLLGKSFLSIKQKLESMYDIDEELKPMKFEHWDKEKIDKMIQDLYRNGKPINRLRLPANLMYQITNHSLPKAKTCNFPAFYPSFDEAIAYNILAVGFERENGELTDKAIKTLQDAIKYYHRKEKMTHAWTKDEIVSLLQDAHAAGLPLTYSFFKSHPTIYKPLIGVERSLEGLRDSIRRNGYDWSELVIEAVPEYVEFYTDDGKLKSSTEEMRVRRFMELNNIPFRTTSDSDKIKVTDPSLIEMGYKHFLPDFIIMDSNGAIQGIVEVFGSIADSAAANTADIYREKKKAKESFYSTLPYKFISINNNTDGVDLTDEILKTKFAIFMGV